MITVSATALHWIFLESCKYTAKDLDKRLARAIRKYQSTFSGTEPRLFLSATNQNATYADLYDAYMNETIARYIEYCNTYPNHPAAVKHMTATNRNISSLTFTNALLARGLT
jgi:hypothetical protein